MKKELRTIHCYDVASFVAEIEKAVKDGFSLDLVTPQNYPQQIGFQFITTMVKGSVGVEKDAVKSAVEPVEASVAQQEGVDSQEQAQEVVEAPKKAETTAQDVKAKPGRPAKTK